MPVEEKKASFWEPQERKGKRGRVQRSVQGIERASAKPIVRKRACSSIATESHCKQQAFKEHGWGYKEVEKNNFFILE